MEKVSHVYISIFLAHHLTDLPSVILVEICESVVDEDFSQPVYTACVSGVRWNIMTNYPILTNQYRSKKSLFRLKKLGACDRMNVSTGMNVYVKE